MRKLRFAAKLGLAGGLALLLLTAPAHSQAAPALTNPIRDSDRPLEYGVFFQGGVGLTENRGGYRFLLAGVQAGKVLTSNRGPGLLHGNFEYGVQVVPFWQSYTPVSQRQDCLLVSASTYQCGAIYNIGGTFTGLTVTPIILRWNLVGTRRFAPWAQGAGGVLWTSQKYPPFGGPPAFTPGSTVVTTPTNGGIINNGSNANTSQWNFTPQFGIGAHYFIHPHRSIDFAANAVHISSASLGDRNPGVNASVQFSVGYTWWK